MQTKATPNVTIIRAGFAPGFYVMDRNGRTPGEAFVSGPFATAELAEINRQTYWAVGERYVCRNGE